MGDLNGDGLADLAVLDLAQLQICIQTIGDSSGSRFACTFDTSMKLTANPPAFVTTWTTAGQALDTVGTLLPRSDIEIADLNGSGVKQVVYFPVVDTSGNTKATAIQVAANGTVGGTRDGLLSSVSNGRGAVTTLTYDRPYHIGFTIPVPVWVVTSLTTTNSLAVTGAGTTNQGVSITKTYAYQNSIFDPFDRVFAGFQKVTETTSADAAGQSPGTVITTNFATDRCTTSRPCIGTDNIKFHAIRGLPVAVEVSQNNGASQTRMSTVVYDYSWTARPIQSGTQDGRAALSLSSYRTHTYFWDQTQTGGLATLTVTDTPSGETLSVMLPSPGTQLIEQRSYDNAGNETSVLDLGAVMGGGTGGLAPVDTPVSEFRTWALPVGDQTGWNWRMTGKQTAYTGNVGGNQYGLIALGTFQSPIRAYEMIYDALGRLTEIDGLALSGVPPIPSGHPPMPGTGSVTNGSTPGLYYQSYDSYGNVITTGSDNTPCKVSLFYDTLYNQLLTQKFEYTGHCNTPGPGAALLTSFVFDRGLGKVRATIAPAGQMSAWQYDDFGREVEVDAPSPTSLGMTTQSMSGSYQDASPISAVYFLTLDPNAVSSPSLSVGHARYFDGFGELRAALNQKGTGALVLSGAHSSYVNGRVSAAYKPWFSNSNAVAFGSLPADVFNPPGTTAFKQVTAYDALGRVKTGTDFNGNPWKKVYHDDQLSMESHDQEQTGGSHQSAYTIDTKDGHGRLLFHTVRNTAGDNVMGYTYLATGEPTIISQNATWQAGPTRTITYDSLGRMATNTESNVGTWTYWHDFDGRVVGMQDTLGCGQDIFYDSLGRTQIKDYIPCGLPGQEYTPYSTPSFSGDGTEAFYVYNTGGQLTDEYDRASHVNYQYDNRGRVNIVSRYLAAPGEAAAFAGRYESNFYSMITAYSLADRVTSRMVLYNQNPIATETTTYTFDGQVAGVSASTGGFLFPFGYTPTILASAMYNPDDTVNRRQYGDASGTIADFSYDGNKVLRGYHLHRAGGSAANGSWVSGVSPPAPDTTTTEADLMNLGITPDRVGNPLTVSDASTAAWPNGAKPTNTSYTYDDNYRLLTVASNVSLDPWVSPYQHESSQGDLSPYALPMSEPSRVASQTYSYDLRGNFCSWTDPNSDLDRSFGSAWYYNSGGGARSPTSATTVGPGFDTIGITNYPTPNSGGYITTYPNGNVYIFYNYRGNQATPSDRLYAHYWDEVGRLSAAIHAKASNEVAIESFRYDTDGNRVRQDNSTYLNGVSSPQQSTLSIFDMLVVKNATYNSSTSTWSAPTAGNTHVYVGGGMAHIFSDASGALPHVGSNAMHTFLRFDDHRKSNAIVVDRDSGEVVERTAYQAYGALDADYRPPRWSSNREDYKQTGNWDNAEIGLVYMNNRYYSPQLGRFISPDPVTIHVLAGDPNPYAYAHGNPMRYGDPLGLDWEMFSGNADFSVGFGIGFSAGVSIGIWEGPGGFGFNADAHAGFAGVIGAQAGASAVLTVNTSSQTRPSGANCNVSDWSGSITQSTPKDTLSIGVGPVSVSASSDGTVSVGVGLKEGGMESFKGNHSRVISAEPAESSDSTPNEGAQGENAGAPASEAAPSSVSPYDTMEESGASQACQCSYSPSGSAQSSGGNGGLGEDPFQSAPH